MKKLMVFIILVLPFFKVAAYETASSDYGVNYQLLQVDKNTQTEMQVDNVAHALGLYFTYTPYKYTDFIYKHWQSTIGGDFVYISDKSPFSQSVAENNSSHVSNKSSKVMGYSVYLETGFSLNIKKINSLKAGFILGYKHNNIDRRIFKCGDCHKEDLNSFSNSIYLKPFISFNISNGIYGQLYLTHYFESSGFKQGLGLQITF